MSKVYLASSWRNKFHEETLSILRNWHEVYDFKNPPKRTGFAWKQIGLPEKPTLDEYIRGLYHPVAIAGFNADKEALDWCDTCVCLLPCGRSAHLEAGYAIGQGKPTFFYIPEFDEPELMYKLGNGVYGSIEDLLAALANG